MSSVSKDTRNKAQVVAENEELRRRLQEAEQTLEAIRQGEVDAIIVAGVRGEQIYSLTGAEHTYRVIVETMNEAALTVDLDGTILFCNQQFCDLMRTPACDVVGHGITEFAGEAQRPALKAAMTEAQAGPVRRHLALQAEDGTAVPVLLSATVLQDGNHVSLCLVASDLTELEESVGSIRVLREQRQALAASEERYRRFFMDDLTGDFIATPAGRVVVCNPAFAAIYGFADPAQAAERCDISQFNRADWIRLVESVKRRGKVHRHEATHRCDDREIYVVANVVGQFDEAGELTGLQGYIFDDTERKLAELALQETNTRLEEQHEDLAAANEQLLTQQEDLQRQTSELEQLKDQAERTAEETAWLARVSQESPDPVLRIAAGGEILYRNPAAMELCRRWNPYDELAVPPSVREIMETAYAGGKTVRRERVFGGHIHQLTVAPAPGAGYVNIFAQDVTERRLAEEALRESEQRLRLAQKAARIGVFDWDLVQDKSIWTEEFCEIFGLRPEDCERPSEAWQRVMSPEERARVEAEFHAAAAQHRTEFTTEYRIERSDGAAAWVVNLATLTYDDEGKPVRMLGVALDITGRRRAEEALRESEEKYRTLFESMNEGFILGEILLDEDGNPCDILNVEVNQAAADYVGLRPEKMVNRRYTELFPQADWDAIALCAEVAASGVAKHIERHSPNTDCWYDCYFYSPRKGYVAILTMDITDRKRAEEALRESEERFRALVTTSSEVLYRMSPDWSEMHQLHSRGFLSNTEKPNRDWLEQYIHPDDQPTVMAAIEKAVRTKSVFELEHRVRRADGSLGWTLSRAVPLMDANGEIVEWFGSAADVTQRKQAEEALRESEERFRTMADGLPMIIWVTDAQGGIQFINRAYGDFFGVTLEQVRGPNWQMVVHPEDAPVYVSEFLACTRERRPFRAVTRVRRADGQWRWIESYGVPRFSETGDFLGIVGSSPDITERKQAEESLRELTRTLETRVAERTRELEYRARQLQKLALELSQAEDRERRHLAEILHDDLQQQLAAVKFHLGILAGRIPGDVRVQNATAQLDDMLRNAIETSRNLSHELSPAVMYHGDMGEIFEWLANQIHLKHGMVVHVDPLGQIDVESDALKVFLFKAVQEMLFNAVKHARVGEAKVRVRRRGRYICLCVSDRGRGFDPRDLKQTTGFGLMSIRERIGLLGGRMRIHSVKGVGSRFIITVPDGQRVEEPVGATPRGRPLEDLAAGESLAVEEGGHGEAPLRVLIADDHEVVRHGLASLLAEAADVELVGQAGNGREAVDMAYQLRPDVVIMDVAMPLMNGDEAARQIRKHLPETRIVALSMYEEPGAVERMQRAGAESYLLKTAPSDELLAAVRGKR